jgi:putative transposase
MTTPRHRTAPGSSYFVTTKCWQSRSIFQIPENAQILIDTLVHYRDRGDYLLHELVIMPDHLHLLLTPSNQTTLEKAIQLLKGRSSHRIHATREHKMPVWQSGFHDWTIRDADDWQSKADYIRTNTVRAKLAARPEDWQFSSASVKFSLDPMPAKYLQPSSGAKAPLQQTASTRGLKPPPPKETATTLPAKRTAVTRGVRA